MPVATMNHDDELGPGDNPGFSPRIWPDAGGIALPIDGLVHRGLNPSGGEPPASGLHSGIGLPVDWGNNVQHGGRIGPL